MIIFVYGTTAEAIKLAPIIHRLIELRIPFQQWLTLQQASTVLNALQDLEIPEPDIVITNGVKGKPLSSSWDTAKWLFSIYKWLMENRKRLKQQIGKNSIILVHGDTLTSVVGSLIAKSLGSKIGHVEAGLRSGSWRHPFPEELDRRIVGKLANVHYAPSEEAVKALGNRSDIIFTHGNTALDVMQKRIYKEDKSDLSFGLVLLHRFEFLNNSKLLNETIETLSTSSPLSLTVVVDDHAKSVIQEAVNRTNSDNLFLIDKLSHQEFLRLSKKAKFVVTDSGGVQEEMAFLGTPTLVHRKATERSDGLGRNVSLSNWSTASLVNFLQNYEDQKHPPLKLKFSPSDIIVNDLRKRGYE